MTEKILQNVLAAGYLCMSQILCLVLDECHNAVGKHPVALCVPA